MEPKQIVKAYLEAMFGGGNDFDRARTLLADNLRYEGPMLEAANADDFMNQMRALAKQVPAAMKASIRHIIGEGSRVAALYEFTVPHPVLFAEWFEIADGKIAAIAIVHDTRPYTS